MTETENLNEEMVMGDDESMRNYIKRLLARCDNEIYFRECLKRLFEENMTGLNVRWDLNIRVANVYIMGHSEPISVTWKKESL